VLENIANRTKELSMNEWLMEEFAELLGPSANKDRPFLAKKENSN